MTLWLPGNPPNQHVMTITRPSSFDHLPPLQMPSREMIQDVHELLCEFVRKSGLKPGVYSSLNKDGYAQVKFVYDEVFNVLKDEIETLDVFDLAFNLYEWLERLIGHIEKRRYKDIPDLMTVGRSHSQNDVHEIWKRVSPYSEGVRWLIEIAVDNCSSSEAKVSESQLNRLIALASELVHWDTTWEHIAHGVLPHDVIIENDFKLRGVARPQSHAALRAYEQAMFRWHKDADKNWLERVFPSKNDSPDIENLVNYPRLNEAMTEELGYNLRDRLTYCVGLIESFDYHEYMKAVPEKELYKFLQEEKQLSAHTIEALLIDHSLSRHPDSGVSPEPVRPVEDARRDSRLMRRPVVVVEQPNMEAICIYGIETLTVSAQRFQEQFLSGLIQFPRMGQKSLVKREIGRIQETLGNQFRDEIAAQCQELEIEVRTEKDRVGKEQIPAGVGFGPVDVFVVDRQSGRFVLVEVKDTQGPGTVPRKLRTDRDRFDKYLEKLELQVKWFESRVEALYAESGEDPSEEYKVEGVIVVNSPRLWMYASEKPLPILTDLEFYDLLTSGEPLLSSVVDVDSNLPKRVLYLPDGQRLRT